MDEERHEDGSPWSSHYRTPDGFVIRIHGMADFALRGGGTEVVCSPCEGLPDTTLRHLFLDIVTPLTATLRGLTVLHAGAIVSPSGAVVLVGPTGSGKSTLTAAFVGAGWPCLGDDYLILDFSNGEPMCLPSYPGLRVWPDTAAALGGSAIEAADPVAHYSLKQRLSLLSRPDLFRDRPTALRQVFVLGDELAAGAVPEVLPLSRRDAALALLEAQFCIDRRDADILGRGFERITELAETADVARLVVPRSFRNIPRTLALVAHHLGLAEGGS